MPLLLPLQKPPEPVPLPLLPVFRQLCVVSVLVNYDRVLSISAEQKQPACSVSVTLLLLYRASAAWRWLCLSAVV